MDSTKNAVGGKKMSAKVKGYLILFALVFVSWLIFKILTPDNFGSPENMLSYFQASLIASAGAVGFYFVLVMGMFDFSIGAAIILASIIGCKLAASMGLGYMGLIGGCLIAGAIIGILNGVFYIKLRIPSMIVTTGLALIGTYTYAIGSNEFIAKNMGINVNKYKVLAFVISGIFFGIMSILTISYGSSMVAVTGMASMSRNFIPTMGCFFGVAFQKYGMPIQAIILGEFMINIIFYGFVALGAPTAIQDVITGFALLIIITLTTKITKGEIVK